MNGRRRPEAHPPSGRLQPSQVRSSNKIQVCHTAARQGLRQLPQQPLGCGGSQGQRPVGTVFLTHLHGDHFGGLPFLLRHAFFAKRTSPLTIAGPPTLRRRIVTALEAFFPGGSSVLDQFEVNFVELQERERTVVDGVAVTAFNALHQSGVPSYSLRLEFGSKVLTYSGDTAWTPTLIEAAAGANIFVCEAYVFNKPHDNHMAFQSLMDYWPKFNCDRLVLTHMSDDMLGHLAEINACAAQDGMRLRL